MGANRFVNWGAWITTGTSSFSGTDGSLLDNDGLIYTAVDGSGVTKTSFQGFDLLNHGLVSMIDGAAGDRTDLAANYDAEGGLLGVDVNFDTEVSDVFAISDAVVGKTTMPKTVSGSTGIVIHQVNDYPTGLHFPIEVVDYSGATGDSGNGIPVENPCDGLCREDDAFFISDLSDGYVNIDGYGATRNGLFASFLSQTTDENAFELTSAWGPDAHAMPGLTTGMQNIGHFVSGVARDHLYGNYFPAQSVRVSSAGHGTAEPAPAAAGLKPVLWARASGSWTDRDISVMEVIGGVPLSFDTGFDQDTKSLLAGADFVNGDFRLGVYGGFVSSSQDFHSYDMSADYSGGTIGAYGTYTNGGLYLDAEVKADLLDVSYNSPIGNVKTSARSIGFLTNAGYRYEMRNFYIEPNGTIAYLRTELDDVNFGGASVDFSNGESLRGGIGVKVGTSLPSRNGHRTDFALSAKVWKEFKDANEVTFTDNATLDTVTYQDRIDGVFGEVGGEVTFYSDDRTFSGFVSGAVQFNDDFSTFSAGAGFRKKF